MITKAVIAAAGRGTRFLPVVNPKELVLILANKTFNIFSKKLSVPALLTSLSSSVMAKTGSNLTFNLTPN